MLTPLVVRAQQGDEEAFVSIVREVGDHCLAIAFRILRDVDVAEDAVQAAIVKAWRELRNLRDPDRFEAWLHRLLVNSCYDEAKRARPQRIDVLDLWPDSGFTTDDTMTVNHRDQLERGFRRLSPDQRAVLVLHYYVGLTVPEVADQLGIPLGTVKSRLHYASTGLRAALEADARLTDISQERSA
jgi:RNA polymerase sigma-70 factor, ECF subfamily